MTKTLSMYIDVVDEMFELKLWRINMADNKMGGFDTY